MTVLARHGVPRTVLNGKDRKYSKVTNRYRARLIEELFTLLYDSYELRSQIEFRAPYGQEDPVAGKWHKLKKRTIKIKKDLGVANPRQINVRTGALLDSTRPGRVVGGRYYTRKGQFVKLSPYTIQFGLTTEYAEAVDNLRTIIPEDLGPWIAIAHNNIIFEIRTMYDAMKAEYKRHAQEVEARKQARRKLKKK